MDDLCSRRCPLDGVHTATRVIIRDDDVETIAAECLSLEKRYTVLQCRKAYSAGSPPTPRAAVRRRWSRYNGMIPRSWLNIYHHEQPGLFAALHKKRMMDILHRAVVGPKIELIVERALGRQVLGHIAPLAPRAHHVHDPPQSVLANVASPLTTSRPSTRRLRPHVWPGESVFDMRPFLASQVARIPGSVTIVFRAVCGRPHWRPLLESGRLP
jgi:hypothetical protein